MAHTMSSDWVTWQLLDSLLPTGAFAHSLGLEAAMRFGFLNPSAPATIAPPVDAAVCATAKMNTTGLAGGPGGEGAPSSGAPIGGSMERTGQESGLKGEARPRLTTPVGHFALAAAGTVSSQLLPFVASAHICFSSSAACSGPQGSRMGGRDDGAGEGTRGSAFERVAKGVFRELSSDGAATNASLSHLGSWSVEGAVEVWAHLDGLLHASLTNHIARKASLAQGQALSRVALVMAQARYPSPASGTEGSCASPAAADVTHLPSPPVLLKALRASMQRTAQTRQSHGAPAVGAQTQLPWSPRKAEGHHATVFGAAAGALGVPILSALRAYLFSALRDVISAATRLNLIGPLEAASLQAKLAPAAEHMLLGCAAVAAIVEAGLVAPVTAPRAEHAEQHGRTLEGVLEGTCVVCPMLDLVQAAHDQLPMRLFLS